MARAAHKPDREAKGSAKQDSTRTSTGRSAIIVRCETALVVSAGPMGMNPDVFRVKDGARAAVTMTTITDRAAETSPGASRVSAAATMTMITGRAIATSLGASQVSAAVTTMMTGRAIETSLVAL